MDKLKLRWCEDDSTENSEGKSGCRRKKRWEDNIKGWRGLDFASSSRAGEGKTRGKIIVVISRISLGWLLGSNERNISFFSPMFFICGSVTIFINNVLTYAEHPCSSTGD